MLFRHPCAGQLPFFASFARPRPGTARFASVLCALLAAGLLAVPTAAQPAPARPFPRAFETVAFSAHGSATFLNGLFDDFYDVTPGARLALSTPFYAGTVDLNAELRRYETVLDSAEHFWAAPFTLGWGARPRLTSRLSLEVAGRLGAYVMKFSGGAPGLSIESELTMGLDVGLSFRFAENWRLVATGRYERVYLNPPIGLRHLSLGVRRTFRMPDGLRNILR